MIMTRGRYQRRRSKLLPFQAGLSLREDQAGNNAILNRAIYPGELLSSESKYESRERYIRLGPTRRQLHQQCHYSRPPFTPIRRSSSSVSFAQIHYSVDHDVPHLSNEICALGPLDLPHLGTTCLVSAAKRAGTGNLELRGTLKEADAAFMIQVPVRMEPFRQYPRIQSGV